MKYEKRQGDDFHNIPVYGAMLDHVDQSVGRIMQVLKEKGFDDNTLFVFTSDNGGYGPATQAPGLRGAKGYPWEGGNRVPLLIRMPDKSGQGRVINEAVNSIDLYPTLVEQVGGSIRMGRYKFIEFFEFGQLELYDLEQDSLESHNIALEKPEVTAKLYERMQAWREETDAPVPTELNPEYDPQHAPQGYITWADVAAKL